MFSLTLVSNPFNANAVYAGWAMFKGWKMVTSPGIYSTASLPLGWGAEAAPKLRSPSSVAISAETLSQAISQAFQQSLPQMLAALRENGAPNSTSSSTSGNSSAAPFVTSVPSTYTSTLTACHLSSSAGSVTVPSFLSTIRLLVFRGSSYFSAARPSIGAIRLLVFRGSSYFSAARPSVVAPSLCDFLLVPLTSS